MLELSTNKAFENGKHVTESRVRFLNTINSRYCCCVTENSNFNCTLCIGFIIQCRAHGSYHGTKLVPFKSVADISVDNMKADQREK